MGHRKVGLNGGSHSLYNPIITDSPFRPRSNVAEENAGNVALSTLKRGQGGDAHKVEDSG